MSRLIELTDWMGTPVAINPAHVTEVHERTWGNGTLRVDILMVNSTPGVDHTVLTVRGTFREIVDLLNGEPSAPPLKAHPDAIGWVQNPELPK